MLSTYLGSVIVYVIIISCEFMLCKSGIRNNGWLDEQHNSGQSKFGLLFCMSAVPVLRVLLIGVVLVMAVYPKEKVVAYINEHRDLNS